MGSKVLNPCPTHSSKGASVASHLRRWARRVSRTFGHTRACRRNNRPSRDASIHAEYWPTMSARGHDGTVTSGTLAEMPVPITAPTFTTTTTSTPMKHPQAITATITHKSSRVSLQLTHELGGYIRRMCSCAPIENMKNTINTKIVQLSLSVTP
jgi:hypothetical protein